MSGNNWFKLVGFFTIVGAIATVLVVPEVRLVLGLDPRPGVQNRNDEAAPPRPADPNSNDQTKTPAMPKANSSPACNVVRLSANKWKVTFGSSIWCDTGIPIIVFQRVRLESITRSGAISYTWNKAKWVWPIFTPVTYTQNKTVEVFEVEEKVNDSYKTRLGYDLKNTLWLLVNWWPEEHLSSTDRVEMIVELADITPRYENDSQRAMHNEAKQWAEDMKGKIASR